MHIISGMPRSGSTLLCNMLNMNEKFHATPTSPLLDMITNTRSVFSHNPTFKSHNRLDEMENIKMAIKGLIEGFYFDKEIVFDKNRGWANKLGLIDEILGHKETKIIWTYRDPVEIVSSIETHYQKTLMLENPDESAGVDFNTLSSRVDTFINDGGLVARPVWLLNDAFETGYGDRILIVKYEHLTKHPEDTLKRIHEFLGEEEYDYGKNNFEDLKQSTFEFDGMYNYKFPHTIKEGSVKFKEHKLNLPQYIIDNINHRFSWVNDLVK